MASEIKHVADMCQGPEYDYLGHWGQRQWLCQGHNDVDASGKQNNADDMNQFAEQNGAANAPGMQGLYTMPSPFGNPL